MSESALCLCRTSSGYHHSCARYCPLQAQQAFEYKAITKMPTYQNKSFEVRVLSCVSGAYFACRIVILSRPSAVPPCGGRTTVALVSPCRNFVLKITPRATKAQPHRPLFSVSRGFLVSAHLPLRLSHLLALPVPHRRLSHLLALPVPHLLSERLPQRQRLLALSERRQRQPALSARKRNSLHLVRLVHLPLR